MRRFRLKQKNKFIKIFKVKETFDKPDYFLLSILGAIAIFGLVMLFSASTVQSFRDFGDPYFLFKHQLLNGYLPGIILFFILAKINYQRFDSKIGCLTANIPGSEKSTYPGVRFALTNMLTKAYD